MNASRSIDQTKILTRSEIAGVLADLKRKAKRSPSTRLNLMIFRLAACCGLRVSEIVGLTLGNVRLASTRPHIYVPKNVAKRRKARKVPLWWDEGTLSEIEAWAKQRKADGANSGSPFLCSKGCKLKVRNTQYRWETAIKSLGPERVETLSIHSGRHSFCSHALAGGRSLAEVRDAAGHSNIATTSIYLHVVNDDDDDVGNLFDFGASR